MALSVSALHHEVRAVCRATSPGLPSSEGLCKSVGTEHTHFVGRLENTGLTFMPTALPQKQSEQELIGGWDCEKNIQI